jgi:hypothetical protein
MSYPPFFHEGSGAVRFWVLTESGAYVGATVSKETLHYRFKADISGSDSVASYQANRQEIDAAVIRRVGTGSIEPVMLREADLVRR